MLPRVVFAESQWSTESGQSFGMRIDAGSTSADRALVVRNAAQSAKFFAIRGDGNVGIGTSATKNLLTVKGKTTLDDDAYVSGNLYVSGSVITADGTSPDHISGLLAIESLNH